jgi:rSAM/selenodomain-associated transferase 1
MPLPSIDGTREAARPSAHLALFLKEPSPGSVKTRLAASIGDEAACSLYRRMVELQLSRLPNGWPVTVHHEPAASEPAFRAWLGESVHYEPQNGGDLGARLSAAMLEHFRTHESPWIALGGDCPGLGADALRAAAAALGNGAAVVLGPALDGGYYLIGLRAPAPELFSGIPWSSSNTLAATLERARALALEVVLLEPLEDVDDLASLRRAQAAGLVP